MRADDSCLTNDKKLTVIIPRFHRLFFGSNKKKEQPVSYVARLSATKQLLESPEPDSNRHPSWAHRCVAEDALNRLSYQVYCYNIALTPLMHNTDSGEKIIWFFIPEA